MIPLIVYIALCLALLALGRAICRSWMQPITVFVGEWLAIVLLYQLRLSKLQVPLDCSTYVVLAAVVISFALGYMVAIDLVSRRRRRTRHTRGIRTKTLRRKALLPCLCIWTLLTMVEIVRSGGVPLYWRLINDPRTYFDYGIPSLHGLLNALGLVIMTLAYYLFLHDLPRRRRYVGIIAAMALYYVVIITRQVLITAVVQMAVVYLVSRGRPSWRTLALLGVALVVAFGVIGNFRTGFDNFLQVSQFVFEPPRVLSGLMWVYMYLTMSLANINRLIFLSPVPVGPAPIADYLLPSVLASLLPQGGETVDFLVTQNFNVSGFFVLHYLSFGVIGVVLISLLYGLLGGATFAWQRQQSVWGALTYAVSTQVIIMSFFTDMLLYLPVSFQLVIVLFMARRMPKRMPNGMPSRSTYADISHGMGRLADD